MHAYHVPPAAGMVKLDAMENPYLSAAGLRDEIARAGGGCRHQSLSRCRSAPAQGRYRQGDELPAGMEVLLGNGSDEIIQLLAMAVAKPGAVLLSVEPSFVMYKMIATFVGMKYVGVPLDEDFSLDLKAMLDAIEREQPALVFLAYPNNPTGNLFDAACHQAASSRPRRGWWWWTRPITPLPATASSRNLAQLRQSAGDAHFFQARHGGVAPRFSGGIGRMVEPVGKAALTV